MFMQKLKQRIVLISSNYSTKQNVINERRNKHNDKREDNTEMFVPIPTNKMTEREQCWSHICKYPA